jgi:putative restriction endonuclease
MKSFVGITDFDWYTLLSNLSQVDEVNFWQPSGNRQFGALQPGELFLFKLHSPRNFIVGGGFFAHASLLPISLAWETFGINNGVESLPEMRKRVEKYRQKAENRLEDYTIGCILLEQPFFLPREAWIPVPTDWKSNIVQGRTYDLTVEPGRSLWLNIQSVLSTFPQIREQPARYGKPVLSMPRLGQGSFRVLVTDAYERRCAITSERTLPALDAAHIKSFSENGPLTVNNGILLRRDLHALFDRGYITITPSYNLEISPKIKEEFENGKEYYKFHGEIIRVPANITDRPGTDFLKWHNESVYRG